MSGVIFIFLQIMQCVPINYNWDGWTGMLDDYRCLDINMLSYIAAAFSIGQDVLILALPLPLLCKLNMTRRRKAGLIVMFSLGVFIIATSCARLNYILNFAASSNPTWDYTDPTVWSGVEISVSIIVTCPDQTVGSV